jgi:hypothetical protein
MVENVVAVFASLIIAVLMVYFVDKKWGGPDDSNQG